MDALLHRPFPCLGLKDGGFGDFCAGLSMTPAQGGAEPRTPNPDGFPEPARAALAVRQNVARWVEKDARAADKVIKREVKSVRKELGALAAEAQQMRTSAKQLENERSSGRPESRSKGVDR